MTREWSSLWDEFDASLITVDRVDLSMKKIAGVLLPVLDGIHYEVRPFSIFDAPSWWAEGIELLKTLQLLVSRRSFSA